MSFWEIVIVLVLFAWFAISAYYAIFNERVAAVTYRADVFRLLSAFQLFSRKTVVLNLSYRDLLADQSVTPWSEASLNHRWRVYHAFWFPQNMAIGSMKSIMDDLVRVVNTHQETGAKKISDRFIYRAIFQFLKRYPPAEDSVARQFRIHDCGNAELFVSDFYKR